MRDDYGNMSRGEAVERCVGLEREVKRMTDAVARINGLERLLRNCRLELTDWMQSHGQDIETKEMIIAIDAALAQQGKGGVE